MNQHKCARKCFYFSPFLSTILAANWKRSNADQPRNIPMVPPRAERRADESNKRYSSSTRTSVESK